jgi:Spy/CpxP family protein refolding chaperone
MEIKIMRTMFQSSTRASLKPSAALGASVLLMTGAMIGLAQAPMPPMAPAGQSASTSSAEQDKQLADQVTELRAQVARLQAAVQNGSGSKSSAKSGMNANAAPAKGMAGGEMGAMPAGGNSPMAMGDNKGEMGGMPMDGMGKAPAAPAAAMGMCCMGEMGSGGSAMPAGAGPMAGMSGTSSAMPGQAGASHLYHIGSTGFFLNHSQHITLTADQKLTLNHLKEKAMLDRASEQRRIDQGEQELYSLTGVDQLDNSRVQAKIGEIEKLRGEQRMNFVRSVEEASKILSPDQRSALLGTMAPTKK